MKGVLTDIPHRAGERYVFQRHTALKCAPADKFHAIWNRHLRQGDTAAENEIAKAFRSYLLWETKNFQSKAAVKSPVPDKCHRRRNDDLRQSQTALKGAVVNVHAPVRNPVTAAGFFCRAAKQAGFATIKQDTVLGGKFLVSFFYFKILQFMAVSKRLVKAAAIGCSRRKNDFAGRWFMANQRSD